MCKKMAPDLAVTLGIAGPRRNSLGANSTEEKNQAWEPIGSVAFQRQTRIQPSSPDEKVGAVHRDARLMVK